MQESFKKSVRLRSLPYLKIKGQESSFFLSKTLFHSLSRIYWRNGQKWGEEVKVDKNQLIWLLANVYHAYREHSCII
jgi:hypothetical protein